MVGVDTPPPAEYVTMMVVLNWFNGDYEKYLNTPADLIALWLSMQAQVYSYEKAKADLAQQQRELNRQR